MNRRDFVKATAAASLIPGCARESRALIARPEPPWVRELRRQIEAIPDDGWDRAFYFMSGSVEQKYLEVAIPGDSWGKAVASALGCVNREGFAGRRAGTVMLTSADWDRGHGTRLRFAVRRGLRWDEHRHPETGRYERIARDGRPLYREYDFESL